MEIFKMKFDKIEIPLDSWLRVSGVRYMLLGFDEDCNKFYFRLLASRPIHTKVYCDDYDDLMEGMVRNLGNELDWTDYLMYSILAWMIDNKISLENNILKLKREFG